MGLEDLEKGNFEQIKKYDEIPQNIIEKIKEIDTEILEEDILFFYNKFLTQGIDFDSQTRDFLFSKTITLKERFRSSNEDNHAFNSDNSLNEFLNYSTFKVILDKIIKDNNYLESVDIYNSSEYMDYFGGVDYQIVIKTKDNRNIVFGLDLKNKQNGENTIHSKPFTPITIDGNGELRIFSLIQKDINNGIQSQNIRSKNSYEINIHYEKQNKINKILIDKKLEIKSVEELGNENIINEVEKHFKNIINRELNILNKGQKVVSQEEEIKNDSCGIVFYLNELGVQKDELLRKKHKEKIIREKRNKIIKGFEREQKTNFKNNKLQEKKINLNTKIQEYLSGKIEIEELLFLIGEENYKKYESICKIKGEYIDKGLKITFSKSSSVILFGEKKEKFEKLEKISRIKLEERDIKDNLNKIKLTIKDKIKILKTIQINFESIFLLDKDYDEFNKHFNLEKLVTLKNDNDKKELLLYLRFLKELDNENKIKISLDNIEKLRTDNLNLDSYNYDNGKNNIRRTLNNLLKKDNKTLEDKFKIFQIYTSNYKITKKSSRIISDIINKMFNNISFHLLNKKEYSHLYKKHFMELIEKLNQKSINNQNPISFNNTSRYDSLEKALLSLKQLLENRIKKENKNLYKTFYEMMNNGKKSMNNKLDIVDYILDNDIKLREKDYEMLNSFLDKNGLNRIKELDNSKIKITKLEFFTKIKKLKEKVDNEGMEKLNFTFTDIERFITKFNFNRITNILEQNSTTLLNKIEILEYFLVKDNRKINGEDLEKISYVINILFKNSLGNFDAKENIEQKNELISLIEKIYTKLDRIGMSISFYKKSENLLDFLKTRKKRINVK